MKIDWVSEKENIEKYINQGLSFQKIANIYGIKNGQYVKKMAIKIGINIVNSKIGYYQPIYVCKYCGEKFVNPQQYGGHVSTCCKNPNYNLDKLKYARTCISRNSNIIRDDLFCQYCGKKCKSENSLKQHEIRCNLNPNKIESGNKGNMPEHCNSYYTKPYKMKTGEELDITKSQLDEYRKNHLHCEICGRTIDETVKWKSKFASKKLCVDHDHKTNKFRGLLCQICNRQLGWYEKYMEEINKYLNK